MIKLFDALTGLDPLPSSVSVEGGDYSIITDYRTWCKLDSYLFDTRVTDEMRGTYMLHMFFPAIVNGEFEIIDGAYPFSAEAARDALMGFWVAGRDYGGGRSRGARLNERPYDFMHDASMIYAAFWQAYGIDLMTAGDLHWWTFFALFSNLPEGSAFAAAKSARVSRPEEFPKSMQKSQQAIKEAYALPDHIRYFGKSSTGHMTEAEYLEHVRQRRAQLMASVKQKE